MKKEILIFAFLLAMLILPFASALDTEINVRTISQHKTHILVLADSDTYGLLQDFHLNSDDFGNVQVVYSGEESSVNINVQIDEGYEKLMLEKFQSVPTGSPVYLQVIPGSVSDNYLALDKETEEARAKQEAEALATETATVQTEETPIEESVDEQPVEESKSGGITASAISDFASSVPSMVYYIVGGLIIALAFVLFIFKNPRMLKGLSKSPQVKSQSSIDTLEDAERKIEEAQKEIAKLRSKEKIFEAEKKLEQDRSALDDLRKQLGE